MYKDVTFHLLTDVTCPGGKVYKECGSPCARDCSSVNAVCGDTSCIDGCFCPDGQVSHNGQCIAATTCPCQHSGKEYQQGETVPELCNTWYVSCTKKAPNSHGS